MPLRQPVRPILELMLRCKSICLMLYIVSPYHASIAVGALFPALSKR